MPLWRTWLTIGSDDYRLQNISVPGSALVSKMSWEVTWLNWPGPRRPRSRRFESQTQRGGIECRGPQRRRWHRKVKVKVCGAEVRRFPGLLRRAAQLRAPLVQRSGAWTRTRSFERHLEKSTGSSKTSSHWTNQVKHNWFWSDGSTRLQQLLP